MQDKYSFAKCEHYGRRLAARLSEQFFHSQPQATLDGPALLKFTAIRQVNLLVLRQLLGEWQQEANRLRSAYFDFEAEPVQAALTQFMNVLSRHLRLGRAALEPLLTRAVADTLLLAADPAAAFERLLLPAAAPADAVPLAQLRESLRYFDQSKQFFQGFVDSLPGGNAPLSHEFLRQRFVLYLPTHAKTLPTVAQVVSAFSALLPLTEADLWGDGPAKPVSAVPTPTSTVPKAGTSIPTAGTSIPTVRSTSPTAGSTVPTAESTLPTAGTSAPTPLYEKLKATQPAVAPLAATLREATHGSAPLAERGAPKVGSLREAISINQRFSFINELFNGENAEYQAAVQHLDSLPTAEAAATYVQHELAARHDWSRKEEHVAKLLKLVERKFAE